MSPATPSAARAADLARLFREKRFTELESAARALSESEPSGAFAWKALGVALAAQGRRGEALAAKQRAADLAPGDGEAQANLGNAFEADGRLEEAAACFEKACVAAPGSLAHWGNLARVLAALGRTAQAEQCLEKAAQAAPPDSPDALNALGNLLRDAGRMPQARNAYLRALALRPDFAEASSNLGNTLSDLGLVAEAETRYRRAIELAPQRAEVHSNLANLLKEQGRLAEAQTHYRQSVALDPEFTGAHSNLLLSMNHESAIPVAESLAEAQRFGQLAMRRAGASLCGAEKRVDPSRPVHVGLVSGDLRSHPVGYFLEGLLCSADPSRIRFHAYPTVARSDALSARIKPRMAQWRAISALGDEAAARLIHADRIDVLLDLSGHTAYNRLGVFAWRPAPVQATWLGYFATTGLPAMDWILADETSIPESSQDAFTERVWYLPDTRLCFTPPDPAPEVAPAPCIANGHLTFGSFQNLAKINDSVLDLWAQTMAAVPASRLRLQCVSLADPAMRAQVAGKLGALGIPAERLDMHGKTSRQKYLQAHAHVDVVLDTFPYPGGTTTCEALWMGVPTLTLAGDRMLSRQGASLLGAAGLHDWIAADAHAWVAKAAALSRQPAALAGLRKTLRSRVAMSPLFDAQRFARAFELAMADMAARRYDCRIPSKGAGE